MLYAQQKVILQAKIWRPSDWELAKETEEPLENCCEKIH